jgi:hypothetical protein
LYKYAILLDGGFIKKKLGDKENLASAKDIINFVEKIKEEVSETLKQEVFLYRTYYYDAPPASFKTSNPISNKKQTWLQQIFSESTHPYWTH